MLQVISYFEVHYMKILQSAFQTIPVLLAQKQRTQRQRIIRSGSLELIARTAEVSLKSLFKLASVFMLSCYLAKGADNETYRVRLQDSREFNKEKKKQWYRQ